MQVPLTTSDVKTVLDALVYGGELEMKQSASFVLDGAVESENDEVKTDAAQSFLYRIAPRTPGFAFLAHIPCTIALVSGLYRFN